MTNENRDGAREFARSLAHDLESILKVDLGGSLIFAKISAKN